MGASVEVGRVTLAAAIVLAAGAAQAKDLAPVTFSDQEAQVIVNELMAMQRVVAALDPASGLNLSTQIASIVAKLQKADQPPASPPQPPAGEKKP